MNIEKPRLLVLEWHHLGDAVMSFPFIRGAADRYEVHVACRPHAAEVFHLLLPPEQVHGIAPPWLGGGTRELPNLWRLLRGFDGLVTSWADARVGVLMRLAGCRLRVGLSMTKGNYLGVGIPWRNRLLKNGTRLEWCARKILGPLYTHEISRRDPMQHRLEDWNMVARALDVSPNEVRPWISTKESGPRHGVLICCGARSLDRDWTGNHARELKAAFGLGVEVRVVCGPEDRLPDGVDAERCNNAEQLCAAISRCELAICNDSFAAHLAFAMGKRVLTIFGPGSPAWFAPGGDMAGAISDPGCPHHPCLDVCRMPSLICFAAITPEMVVERAGVFLRTIQSE